MRPAAIALTEMPNVAASRERHLVKPLTAAFDVAYRAAMPEPYPVRTTVGSQLLGILVEIDVVAEGAR